MIEALLSIIDRLIELKRGRTIGRTQMFDRLLEPTFNDLLIVHGDYIKMFEQLRVLADTRPSASTLEKRVNNAKAQLREKRIEFEPVRQKIRTISGQLAKKKLQSEERQFVDAVVRYLPSGEPSLPRSSARTLLLYLDQDLTPAEIDMMLLKTIERHRNAWSDVCIAFASLKVTVASQQ